MPANPNACFLHVDPAEVARLRNAIVDPSPVSGLTHTFYRYPARFSPLFVRQAIETFTAPRDVVADPFMGGGTTLVEATALGRYAFGTDISALAAFVARVKTRVYTESQLHRLRAWAEEVSDQINMRRLAIYPVDWAERGYLKHLETRRTWRLSKATQQALGSVLHLSPVRVEEFARCVILRTAQWAMDARREVPSVNQFRQRLIGFASEMLAGAEQYRRAVEIAFPESEAPEPICLHRPADGLNGEPPSQGLPRPKLVLTSPPYPGVHVIYHRWQVEGRKETPAPFWIANQLDGSGAKYYMLGDHREVHLRSYYENLLSSFLSIRGLCSPETIVVQLVAFAEPNWQLPHYLNVMNTAGFRELLLPGSSETIDGRLWRRVPNRRWHAGQLGETAGANEVVLIHTSAPSTQPLRHFPRDTLRPRPVH